MVLPLRARPWPVVDEARQRLVRFSREAATHGLVVSTCGNASLRLDEGRMLLTGTGTELAQLSARHLSTVALATGLSSGAKPSSEWELHRQVYLARPEVGAVLHCQSQAATLLACSYVRPVELNLIPEIPAYVGRHAYVPYFRPGTLDLAWAVVQALSDRAVTVVQLTNHGQLVVGQDARTVLRRAIFFERACWLALQGRPLSVIPPEECEHLAKTYGSP